jgi:hypothetical protein
LEAFTLAVNLSFRMPIKNQMLKSEKMREVT